MIWAQKNDVQKYDVISFALESENEGRYEGEVVILTDDLITLMNKYGDYDTYHLDEIIDLDHIKRADRTEVYRH